MKKPKVPKNGDVDAKKQTCNICGGKKERHVVLVPMFPIGSKDRKIIQYRCPQCQNGGVRLMKKLLKCLESWFASYRMHPGLTVEIDEERQAYTQLKEIVEIVLNFTPTAEYINALPESIRNFIHDIETNCDPSGIIRENVLLKDTIEALRIKIQQKPRVTRKDIFNFRINLFTIEMEYGNYDEFDDFSSDEIEGRELSYIENWLKSKGIEVTDE